MLELHNIHASYGAVQVLHGVSLTLAAGEIVTLIGANGAGKSTLLKVVSGLLPATQGSVRFAGRDIAGMPAHQVVRLGLVHSPEGRRIFARMSVQENLQLGAYIRQDKTAVHKEIDSVYALFPILGTRRKQLAGTLSGGEQQMLALGRAMLTRPLLLMLDEPSLGLAPQIVRHLFAVIARLHASGVTVLLVEQNAQMALKLAHRGYVLETGRITMADQASTLLADPRIRSAYLGD